MIPSVAPLDGGPSVAIRALAAAQHALGANVTVATTDSDGAGGSLDVTRGEPVDEGGVCYRYFARELPGVWKPSLALYRWLRAETSRFDAVHIHALFCFSTAAGARAAFSARVPYVVSPHGALDPWSLGQSTWKKTPYLALVERRTLQRASALHVTTEAEASALRRLGLRAPIHVVPLGMELADVTRGPRLDGAPLRLLFLGRLHEKKGIDLLLRSLGRATGSASDARLTIAGAGAHEYRAELEKLVTALGLGDRVTFAGHVEGEAKHRLLAESDAFALTSHQENFGIAVAEAMAAGLPVIVSDAVGLAPFVRRADAGEVVPLDVAAIAAAVERIAADPAGRLAAGARAAAAARSELSWERTARRLLEIYAGLRGAGATAA